MKKLSAIPAPILEDNLDTDVIFPARFLLLLERKGLGRYAFFERRSARRNFVLDTPPWKGSPILLAGQNFGTGSSREQAVWSLADLGIQCVIAPSFGEIFFANCFRNGLLPIVCDGPALKRIREDAQAGRTISVDLAAQEIRPSSGTFFRFEISPHRKAALMARLDEVGVILRNDIEDIEAYEARNRMTAAWKLIPSKRLAALHTSMADRHPKTVEKEKHLADTE